MSKYIILLVALLGSGTSYADFSLGKACRNIRKIDQLVKIYHWSVPSEESREMLGQTRQAFDVICSGQNSGRLVYRNGQEAAFRNDGSWSWYYPNGEQIVFRPTEQWTWHYPNGEDVAFRLTDDWTWYYPNGQEVAFRLTTDWTWYYANGQEVSFRPTKDWSWSYPNGQDVAFRLTSSWKWNFSNGSEWLSRGMDLEERMWSDPLRVIMFLYRNNRVDLD